MSCFRSDNNSLGRLFRAIVIFLGYAEPLKEAAAGQQSDDSLLVAQFPAFKRRGETSHCPTV